MHSRREFFRSAVALGVVGVLPNTARADDPPPFLDVRDGNVNHSVPLVIKRHGERLKHVIAYNVNENWVLVYRLDPNGHIIVLDNADEAQQVKLCGGVTVEWDWEQIRKDKERSVLLKKETTFGVSNHG